MEYLITVLMAVLLHFGPAGVKFVSWTLGVLPERHANLLAKRMSVRAARMGKPKLAFWCMSHHRKIIKLKGRIIRVQTT